MAERTHWWTDKWLEAAQCCCVVVVDVVAVVVVAVVQCSAVKFSG